MKMRFAPALRKRQMKNRLCGLLAGMGLMLGSYANAAVMHFDDLDASGALSAIAKYAPSESLEAATHGGVSASAITHDEDSFVLDDLSIANLSDLPEPGAATLLALAVLASGVVRARNIQ